MAIEHEIVKFVAEMELDAKTTAQFTQGLKDSNDKCAELRKTIVDTQKKLMEMKSAGKENSDAYKELEKDLGKYNTELKNASAHANKFASALGVNQMSMNQLKAYTKKLRNEMNSLHKETNPELWNKYNKKLKEAEKRMGELKGGSKSFSEILSSFSKKAGPAFAIAGSAITMVTGLINKAADTTQRWGDQFGILKAQSSAVIDHMVATITNWKNRSKASIKEVWDAAAEAQQLRDGLFEKNNALKIAEAEARIAIANEMKIVNDSTKTAEERLAAQERILEIEMDLARQRKNIANDSLDAAYKDLERIKMTEKDLEFLVENYDKNSDIIKRAEEFIKNEEKLEKLKKKESRALRRAEGKSTDSEAFITWEKVREERITLEETLKSAYSLELRSVVDMLKKYNLGNDNLIEAYVNARVQLLDAQAQYDEAEVSQGRKRSSLVNQMTEEEKKRQEQVFNDKVKEADDAYSKELTDLKNSLAKKEITEEEFHEKSLAAEGAYLLKKKAILQAYGKETVEIEGQIADWRLEAGTPEDSPNRPTTDLSVSGDLTAKLPGKATTSEKSPGLARPAETFETEMTALNILHESKIISEEEFLKAKSALLKKYNKEDVETEQTLWEQGVRGKLQATQMMLDAMGQAVSSAKDAELATLDAKMQAELAAAGDNADKRAEIEAKYEAKKLDVQKKYADVELGINIAQALAQGALAVIQTWGQLGPIAGSIMAAVVAATTAAQIAVMVQQRNAIKNSTVSSAPSSSSSTTSISTPSISPSTPSTPDTPAGTTYIRKLNGYSDGGYTGSGGRLEVAGVVHRGEYVVPQPEMRDPAVLAMVASIESRRRRRTSANALPGFAEGGYTGDSKTEQILTDILRAIENNNDNPVPAYVVLSEYEAKKDLCERIRRAATLRVIP